MIGNVIGGGRYQIGEFYLSSSSTSPAILFGGTWEQVKDKFLLAAGDAYSAGSTGGEVTHALTVDEMPSHLHKTTGDNVTVVQTSATKGGNYAGLWYSTQNPAMTGTTGGGQPHNNMPPYLTIYIWRRIA